MAIVSRLDKYDNKIFVAKRDESAGEIAASVPTKSKMNRVTSLVNDGKVEYIIENHSGLRFHVVD